jgi:hypothetical protein
MDRLVRFGLRACVFGLGLILAACNPIQPDRQPHTAPVPRVNTADVEHAPHVIGNVRPKKYGSSYLLDYARQQAGTDRPGSELGFSRNQLSFSKSIGRNK